MQGQRERGVGRVRTIQGTEGESTLHSRVQTSIRPNRTTFWIHWGQKAIPTGVHLPGKWLWTFSCESYLQRYR